MGSWESGELDGHALTASGLAAGILDRLDLPAGDELVEVAQVGVTTLDVALAHDSPELLADYLAFASRRIGVLTGGHVPCAQVRSLPRVLLGDALPADDLLRVEGFLDRAVALAPKPEDVHEPPQLGDLARRYLDHALAGRREAAVAVVHDAAESGADLGEILTGVLEAAQVEIGRLWEEGSITVAQEHYCTAVTQLALADLYPYLFTGAPARGRHSLVAVQARGSLHEVGLRMVADLLEHHGWTTTYLGAEPDPTRVVAALLDQGADVLAISASMAGQIGAVAALVRAVRGDPRTARVAILVGGRPFAVAPALVDRVGADGTARDARDAVAWCVARMEATDVAL